MKKVRVPRQSEACAGMRRRGLKVLFAAVAAVMALGASAAVITIPENGTLVMGGTGADPNNKTGNCIVFTPGSTLVVTSINDTLSIWTSIIATNGAATVRCGPGDTDSGPTFQYHCFIKGAGSLTLKDMKEAYFGHSGYYPVVDLGNLYKDEGVGVVYLVKGASVLAFPTNISYMLTMEQDKVIRLCGKDMFPGQDVIEFASNRCKVMLCNPEAIPAGKTLRVKGDRIFVSPLTVPDPDDGIVGRFGSEANTTSVADGYVYNCNFELVDGSTLTFANSKPITVNGPISGYNTKCGNIALSGYKGTSSAVTLGGDNSGFRGRISATTPGCELVLSNANAAVNATLDMSIPYAVRIAEGLPAVSIASVVGGTDILNDVIQSSSGQTISVGSFSGALRASGTGVEAVVMPKKGEGVSVGGEGSFVVKPESVLHAEVGYWFDFSRDNTRLRIGEGSTDDYLDRVFATGKPYVERVVDWRYPDVAKCLWNRRLYKNEGGYDIATSTYPYVAGTQNGLPYISMSGNTPSDGADNSSRRLPFSSGSGYNTVSSCSAQLVVMVFGAQNGGGWAMLGTTEGAFGRGVDKHTIAAPITTNTAHDVWQDGVKVNPSTTYFKNGFQVMSVALDGLHFNGLGLRRNVSISPNEMGGQNYGEVLVFTNAVSDRVRLEAELYLARKWGLESQYSSAAVAQLNALRVANPVCIATAGSAGTTINAGEHSVSVEGQFAGTVNLDGGALVVPDRPLPYAESDIPSAGRLYWADPDDSETVKRIVDDPFYRKPEIEAVCSNEVRAIVDKSVRSLDSTVGHPILYVFGDRRPTPIRQSRGLGVARTWLDFNDYVDTTLAGNCLRFITCPALTTAAFRKGDNSAGPLATMNVRTAFVVQDSVRGGGAPLLTDVGGTSYPKNRANGDCAQTIYPDDKPDALVNGENRLNGNVVDYTKGFLGQPEVFTVRGTEPYNLPFIGCYLNTEGGKKNGEIIGEVLLYNTALSDDDVKGIEAYLMGKWIGQLPDGYADIRQATVAGTGTVQVAVGSQRPNIDRGFEGTVSIAAGGDFTMTIDPDSGKVMGALDCPAATLSLPASCSITLNFTRKPPKSEETRTYTLVDCASGASGVEWTFTTGANAPRKGVFMKSGNTILYKHFPPGTLISFR